jgi:hypothetical protein
MNLTHRNILEDLEAVRENLMALSDDIWLSIDHNNTEEMKRGCAFKEDYNNKMVAFDALATGISEVVQQFTQISLDSGEQGGTGFETDNDRIIRELNQEQPHSINEDFTYCRPHGFILKGTAITGVITWKRMYTRFCELLYRIDGELFRGLPENEDHMTPRGLREFSPNPEEFHEPILIGDSIYTEGHMSANMFCKSMSRLIKTYNIPISDLQIFLREDRDAERNRQPNPLGI